MDVTDHFRMIITSAQNPRIRQVIALRDRRAREREGVMRVEGYDEVSLALASGTRPVGLYFCSALFQTPEQAELLEQVRRAGAELIEVSAYVFHKIAYREGPDGWLATFPAMQARLDDLHLSAHPFILVAESVEKPGNLGAMLRTADAAGVDALIASDPLTDWGNPNIVRSSKGALFSVPVAAADNAQTIAWLRRRHVAIVAATPHAPLLYSQADLRGPVALAVGPEKHGLSRAWLDTAAVCVRIPMFGRVNSLNVATAAALLMYEVIRQRWTPSGVVPPSPNAES
jgi:TrmH family RNA methyltransferase